MKLPKVKRAASFAVVLFLLCITAAAAPCLQNDSGKWCWAPEPERTLHFAYSGRAQDEEQFSINVHQIDMSRFPLISAYVSVLDDDGWLIPDIPPGLFTLTENNQVLDFELDTVASEEGGIKVALIVDESGSMSGDKFMQARQAVMCFVNFIKPLDRFAVVSYASWARVIHEFTSIREDLVNSLSQMSAGGSTSMYDGMILGLDLAKQERGVKALIAFTDGMENNSVASKQELLDYAAEVSIPIYTIGFGSDADEAGLIEIAEATGGLYHFAPGGDELVEIYEYLKSLVASEYLLMYETPNEEHDRLTRVVEVCVNYWGEEKCAYSTYRATEPPKIELTDETKRLSETGYSHPASMPIEIKARITDDEAVTEARVLWRQSRFGDHPYVEADMTLDSLGYYAATLDSELVTPPGIVYFVLASDELTTVSEPAYMPEKYAHHIAIQPNMPPMIDHRPRASAVVGADMLLAMDVTDDTECVDSVIALVRPAKGLKYELVEAQAVLEENTFVARIPGEYMTEDGMEYCILARDNYAVSSWHGSPAQPHYVAPHVMTRYPIYVYAKTKEGQEVPLDGAQVYINGLHAGDTDASGTLVVDSLSIDDQIFAVKEDAARVLSARGDRGALDDTSLVLNLHNGVWGELGRFEVYRATDLVPDTPDNRQPILLSCATIGINLLVSIEFDASAAYIENLVEGLRELSDLIFDATNGQFRLNDVAIYDDKECWDEADIRVCASNETRPSAVLGGVEQHSDWLQSQCCTVPWGFSREIGPLADNALERLNAIKIGAPTYFTDPHLTSELLHLMGHYLFSLYDENLKGDRSSFSERSAASWPRSFGLMDSAYLAKEFSSWNEYPGMYATLPPSEDGAANISLQLLRGGHPCWQEIEQRFEAVSWPEVDFAIDVTTPRKVYYSENGEDTDLPGPENAGGLGEVSIFDSQPGVFDVTLVVSFEGVPIPDASVLVESPYFSYRGRTDSDGKVNVFGVRQELRVLCYATTKGWLDPSYPYCVGEAVIENGQTTYPVECHIPGEAKGRGAGEPTPVLISGRCHTDSEGASLDLTVTTGEQTPFEPTVKIETAGPPARIYVGMQRATMFEYVGSASVARNPVGAITTEATDANGHVSIGCSLFSLHPVRSDGYTEVVAADGGLSLLFDEGEVSEDQALLIISSDILPPNPPDGRVLISKVHSLSLESDRETLQPGSQTRLIFHLGQRFCAGTDARSFAVYRYDTDGESWEPLGGDFEFDRQLISIRTDRLGVFAVFGLPSEDTTPPGAPSLSAVAGQCKRQVMLVLKSPEDDAEDEPVLGYEIRYSEQPIATEDSWSEARLLTSPEPTEPGSDQYLLFDMPEAHKEYYFAVKSVDEAENVSYAATASGHSPPAETRFYDASAGNGSVELVWETQSEQECRGWHVWQRRLDEAEFTRISDPMVLSSTQGYVRQRYAFEARGLKNAEPYCFVIENLCRDGSVSYSHEITQTPNGAGLPYPARLELKLNGDTFTTGSTIELGVAIQNFDEPLLLSMDIFLVMPTRQMYRLNLSFPVLFKPYVCNETTIHSMTVGPDTLRGDYEVWGRLRDAPTGAILSKQEIYFTVQ